MKHSVSLKSIATRAVLFVVVTSILFLCGCADFGFGTEMPTEIKACTSYENDDYLVIDCFLADKHSGKVSILHWSKEAQEIADELSKNSVPSETFSFEVNSRYEHNTTKGANSTQQNIIDYIKSLYDEDSDTNYTTLGIARPVDDKFWFSITTTDAHGFDSGTGLYEGIISSKIMSYDPSSKQFKTVLNYDKSDAIIVDFDENGIFTFDVDGNLNYYNLKSEKSTYIWAYNDRPIEFIVTDDHICANYTKDSTGYCFVYQKHGEILTDIAYG